mgnify:CR=1 FL=1|tara:strand:+ start:2854 stop:5508 length:2655 start_codon:yes stop_codon:yes gene_type:complete
MKNTTLLSDLLILLKLYTPKNAAVFIFDPFERLTIDSDFPLNCIDENSPKVLVSFADEVIFYKGMQMHEFDIILDFGKSKMPNVFNNKTLNYINNPDKSMRWLYSNQNKSASFLSFYNASTFRAKLISRTIKMAFKIGLKTLIKSGSFNLYHQSELKLNKVVNQLIHQDYSLFMGTAGANRTLLIELCTNGSSTHFIKVPLNKESAMAIVNEGVRLDEVNTKGFDYIISSKQCYSKFDDVLITENIKPKYFQRSDELLDIHFNALHEMATKTIRFYHLKSTNFWEENTTALSLLKRGMGYDQVIDQLMQLKTELREVRQVYTSLAHCDFTPWNMFVGNKNLFVYDWEQGQSEVPLLYDLFHFHFQTGVLSKRISFQEIKANILSACKNEKIADIIKTYNLNIENYFKIYLLQMITTNINSFQEEKKLSIQQIWQLNAYKNALKETEVVTSKEVFRNQFIREFNQELKRTTHAFLKFTEGNLENLKLSSDLDILVLKGDIRQMIKYCKNHIGVLRINTYQKSFMTTVELYFKDGSFLTIDLINQFKRKGMQFLDAKSAIISALPNINGSVIVPSTKFDFEYCFLFYTLNGASIPEKYKAYYFQENKLQNDKVFNYINKKYNLKLSINEDLFSYNDHVKDKIIERINQYNISFTNRIRNNINYILDTLKDIIYRKGMVITFSGVDGAGKSTIIEIVKNRLQTKYRKEVVLLRHRPGILPILSAIKHGEKKAEEIASVTLPRKGKNNNIFSSVARFGYYFADYMIGQVYVYFKYVLRGKIVLYDRYYFDFINDAKRSNIQLNRSFVKALYRFVFKPKLNFFLYADAQTILARKQEMIAPEIDELTILYKQLFTQMSDKYKSSHYTIIENNELDVTLNKIMNSYAKLA